MSAAAAPPMLEPKSSAAIDFLKQWEPEGPWVLSAIAVDQKDIKTATFYPGGKKAKKWLDKYNGKWNLYFHVNRPMRDLEKKAERQDIKEITWLHIDIDPRAGEDLDKERERALNLLLEPPKTISSWMLYRLASSAFTKSPLTGMGSSSFQKPW